MIYRLFLTLKTGVMMTRENLAHEYR